jgi:WD40 repeat protein
MFKAFWTFLFGKEKSITLNLPSPPRSTKEEIGGLRAAAGGDTSFAKLNEGGVNKSDRPVMLRRFSFAQWPTAVLASPLGGRLFIASSGVLKVIDANTGAELGSRKTPADGTDAKFLASSPDGRYLLVGAQAGSVHLLNAESLDLVREFSGKYYSASFSSSSNLLAIDGEIWDLDDGKQIIRLPLPERHAMLQSATFTHAGRTLVTGGQDGTCRVWNIESGACIQTIIYSTSVTSSRPVCAAILNEAVIATGSNDGFLRLWDFSSGQLKWCSSEGSAIHGLVVSPDKRWIAQKSGGRTGRVWSGAGTQILSRESATQYCYEFLPDSHLVFGSVDGISRKGNIEIWSLAP